MIRRILYCVALGGGLLPSGLHAQDLTLRQALDIALANNLGIRVARNGVAAATINNSYGVAGGLPQVSITGSDIEQTVDIRQKYATAADNSSRNGATSNSLSGGLNASLLLYNGERVVYTKRALNQAEIQSKDILSSRALALAYNVMLKYYDVVRQQSYALTLQRSIDASRERLNIIRTELSLGMANNADLFQSQVDLNTQLQNLKAQQLVIDQDKTDLLTLLTLSPDSVVSVRDTIIVDSTLQLKSVLATVAQNPDIAAANDQITINQFVARETNALRYPSLTVNIGYNLSRTQNSGGFSLLNAQYGPFIGLGVNIPIFNGFIYKKQAQVADINVSTARLLRDTLTLAYTAGAVKNYQAYTNTLEQLTMARDNYQLAGQLLDLVMQRFGVRQATIVDVRNAQDSYENAGYQLVNLAYAAKVAEINLKRYANTLKF
ncbi:TolC family protein [Dinghuibacter silviterrae]|uniref:Outer membrane protein TolC n=1 Tax=Dinghuibacter silviterrae TaxID=1539049 RepID=A0A4R8DUJ5_9BACT|nr:TolC family protein [Dinghuibacter silviterrae]TDX01087.1 outer membrane protein TolC [Dinghuibacter silviterrae]